MGHSIEGRFPFLDYRVAEFAAALPYRLRLRGLEEKTCCGAPRTFCPSRLGAPQAPYGLRSAVFSSARSARYVRELLSAGPRAPPSSSAGGRRARRREVRGEAAAPARRTRWRSRRDLDDAPARAAGRESDPCPRCRPTRVVVGETVESEPRSRRPFVEPRPSRHLSARAISACSTTACSSRRTTRRQACDLTKEARLRCGAPRPGGTARAGPPGPGGRARRRAAIFMDNTAACCVRSSRRCRRRRLHDVNPQTKADKLTYILDDSEAKSSSPSPASRATGRRRSRASDAQERPLRRCRRRRERWATSWRDDAAEPAPADRHHPGRSRGADLHLRLDRHPEGRDADAREHGVRGRVHPEYLRLSADDRNLSVLPLAFD